MNTDKKDLKYKPLTEKIIKGYYEVYNELGVGFLESVYEKAMVMVLESYNLGVAQQYPVSVTFRSQVIGDFKADLLVNDKIILDLKSVKKIVDAHKAQIINYLRASEIKIGLLFYFGPNPEFKRFIYD